MPISHGQRNLGSPGKDLFKAMEGRSQNYNVNEPR